MTHAALHAQSLAKLAVVGYCAEDVYLHTAPLFHVGAPCELSGAAAVAATLCISAGCAACQETLACGAAANSVDCRAPLRTHTINVHTTVTLVALRICCQETRVVLHA